MQAKMASRSRVLNRLYEAALAPLIPLFGWLARTFPLGLLYAIGRFVTVLFGFVRPKYERALRSNFAQILGQPPSAPSVRALAHRLAQNHVRYWIDFFYWSERGADAARAAVPEVENPGVMERCLGEGRGCILLTAHLGNWEMGGLLLGPLAREAAVVYVPDRFEVVERYRSRYRRSTGLTEIPLTGGVFAALPALRILREGGIVAVQGDRDFSDSGVAIPFFGRQAFFPRGPAALSLMSRAPIVPVFILRCPDLAAAGSGGFRIVFFDPIEPEGDPRDGAAVEALVARTASVIEKMVRAYPDQWYCFYPFWEASAHGKSADGGDAQDQRGRVAPTAATLKSG